MNVSKSRLFKVSDLTEEKDCPGFFRVDLSEEYKNILVYVNSEDNFYYSGASVNKAIGSTKGSAAHFFNNDTTKDIVRNLCIVLDLEQDDLMINLERTGTPKNFSGYYFSEIVFPFYVTWAKNPKNPLSTVFPVKVFEEETEDEEEVDLKQMMKLLKDLKSKVDILWAGQN